MTIKERIRLMLGKAHPSDVIEFPDEILTVGMARVGGKWEFYPSDWNVRGLRVVNMPRSLMLAYADALDHFNGLDSQLSSLPYSHRKRKRRVQVVEGER